MSSLKLLNNTIWASSAMLLALNPLALWGQSDTGSQPAPDTGNQPGATSQQPEQNVPAPAFGSVIPSASENPPISGLDQPSLEPGGVTRSFLAPGFVLSESGDSNVSGSPGSGNGAAGVTRAMGSLTLQKIWSRYESDFQYIAGGVFYEGVKHSADQIHEADLAQRAVWRTGQLVFRDNVSYLPEGAVGAGSYGGSVALQSGLAGLGGSTNGISSGSGSALGGAFSASQFGSVGQVPRLTNSATADVAQALTPRSSVTFAGSYGFVHFTDNSSALIDSNQFVAQAGYSHQINRTDQLALSYGFQNFHFPQLSGSSVITNTVHVIYGHRISGRMDFVAGAGPQFTKIQSPLLGSTTRVSASGNVRLRYRFPRTSVQMEYKHYNTNGSGYFLGSSTDVGTFSVTRPLGRVWEASSDMGVADNKRLTATAVALPSTSDRYLFVGGAVHRHIGRRYRMFISYQYNRFSFNKSAAVGATTTSNRQMGVVGIEWYPRPRKLD